MTPISPDDLRRQFAFLAELEKLKSVMRQSTLVDLSGKENSAEHSWHLAMFALVFAPYATGLDTLRAVKMLLLHDIVEIDAGDVPFHLALKDLERIARIEAEAAERIFGLLPEPQADEMRDLWLEFEAGDTLEARFARALDRLQPVLLNMLTDGGTWNDFAVTEEEVLGRCGPPIERGAPELWPATRDLIRAHFASRKAEAGSYT